MQAMTKVLPSTQRESKVQVQQVTWDDIGGLEDVKLKLRQAVEWPIMHRDSFERLGLRPPRGILLHGPPGCSKTTLVKAVATTCNANFLALSGASVYSPFVGDAEKAVREIFSKARAGAPSLIFLDEIEAMVGKRSFSQGSGGDSVQERVLSTMLNEMDGVESVEGVLVVGATNRVDLLDPALLRPGRFDEVILVPPPDAKSRLEILRVHTKKTPLDETVRLEDIAQQVRRVPSFFCLLFFFFYYPHVPCASSLLFPRQISTLERNWRIYVGRQHLSASAKITRLWWWY